MSQGIFGTDGVRGRAGRDLITFEGGVRVGRSAIRLARDLGGSRVLVARDPRESGETLEDGVTVGVTGEGGHVVLAGVQPTSAVSIAVDRGLADVGVMITASHNPARDNGFKVVGSRGRKLDDAAIAQFEAWLHEPLDETTASGRYVRRVSEVRAAWSAAAEAAFAPDGLAGRALAVDLANGASADLLSWLQERVPAAWSAIGTGDGEVNDRVGSEHPEALAELVRARRCAAGIAVDGDGDRCVLIDERGERVAGDALAWLLAKRLGVKHLVVTEMSNGALETCLPNVKVHRVPVGDRYLRQAMDANGWPLGCEESGHVLFHEIAGGDGLITGLRALSLLAPDESLSEAVADFAPLPRKLSKVRVGRRPPLENVAEIQQAVRLAEGLLGPGGRVFLRYSGTEPVLRILAEGDAAAVDTAAQRIALVAEEALR